MTRAFIVTAQNAAPWYGLSRDARLGCFVQGGSAESKPRLSTETPLMRAEPHILGAMRDNTLLCLDTPEQKKYIVHF